MKFFLRRIGRLGNHGVGRVVFLALAAWMSIGPGKAHPAATQEAGTQKRVLLIYDARRELLGNTVVDRTIRQILGDTLGANVDIRSEYFEPSDSPEEDYPVLLAWLRRKYADARFDVIVPVGTSALQFVREHGLKVFHDTQVVYWGNRSALDNWDPRWPITGIVTPELRTFIRKTVNFIRAAQPDVEHLAVVAGNGVVDQRWEAAARQEINPTEDFAAVSFLTDLTLEEVGERLTKLPPKSAVLFFTLSQDARGRQFLRSQFLGRFVENANAPIYSTSVIYLGMGIAGGALADQELMSVDAAKVVIRLLQGEDIRNVPLRETSLIPTANWNAMKRWGLREANLPPGTVIWGREPSLWDTHRWHIIGIVSLCIVEATLIVALLIHRANRRRAERALMESEQLLQSTIDALNVRVALLDENGTIIATNRRWKTFAKERPDDETTSFTGTNYLDASRSRAKAGEAQLVLDGIKRVIDREAEDFRCVYPITQDNGTLWFQVRVNRFDNFGVPRVVVTQEDVTDMKRAHEAQQQLSALMMRAQDEERRRIARDLHDVTVQNIVAIKGDLNRIERESKLETSLSETLQESLMLCNQVMHELRTLSYLLHPPFLDEAGLLPALQWFVRGFIQRSGVPVELLVLDDIGRLPGAVETALFRVVQESLTNIHRHSGSRSAIIWVGREHDNVILRIVDEGHGFSSKSDHQEAKPPAGVGIQSMRERLRQLGGDLEIESSSKGTTVYAKICISKEKNATYLTR